MIGMLDHPNPDSPPQRAPPRGWSRYSGDNVQALRLLLTIALTANVLAGVLLALDLAIDGQDDLFEALRAIDLLGLGIAVLPGFSLLRKESAKNVTRSDEMASLAQAKQAAENASRAKSRYLATVSHEIRSPLNAIYGYAQLAERNDGVSPQEAARVICRSTEHLTSLVEGLLDIAQLEFGVLRARSEMVRFGPFIEQIVWMMRPAAAAKGIDFIFEPAKRIPEYVRLDPSRFRQVMINLLSNAIKFTDSGSVTLAVRYSGQIATFEVRDTGPGIAPEDHERIFEPFERGGDADAIEGETGSGNRPGAGLGLAITRAIVQVLGGKLEMESDLGAGTCFRITMMLGEVAGRIVPRAVTRRITSYEGRRRTILLIEDDADQLSFLGQFLGSLGFDVVAAPSGEQALEMSAGRLFDLGIIDISLPGISGWEAAMKLRERLGGEFRILMLSANSDELHRPDYATPVHDMFLVKPVQFENLADVITDLLQLSCHWEPTDPLAEKSQARSGRRNQGRPALSEQAKRHVHQLQDYLRIGYVRGIEAEIRQLAETAPEAAPLVARLFDCLDRYDLGGIAKLLQES